jgi:hypothetical protein
VFVFEHPDRTSHWHLVLGHGANILFESAD